jgi:EF hand
MTVVVRNQGIEGRNEVSRGESQGSSDWHKAIELVAALISEGLKKADTNQDGKISTSELQDLMKSFAGGSDQGTAQTGAGSSKDSAGSHAGSVSDSHKSCDAGGDTSDSGAHSKGSKDSSASDALSMSSLDKNEDGVVSIEELLAALGAALTGEDPNCSDGAMPKPTGGHNASSGGGGDASCSTGTPQTSPVRSNGGGARGEGAGETGASSGSSAAPMADVPGGSAPTGKKTDIRGTRGDDYHYQNSGGTETFRIGSGDAPAGEKYDPRSEVALKSDSFKKGEGNHTFSGDFQVKSGDDTTIAQIINFDSNASDKHVPSAFVTFSDGKLYQGHKEDGKLLADVGNDKFNLSITSNGENYSIKVDGKQVGSFEAGRSSGENTFKYGAYHHGAGEAEIGVSNVRVSHS